MGNVKSRTSQHKSVNSIVPLYEACRDGNEELVKKLLPKYSHHDLNQQVESYNGNTCLHVASANGHDDIVKLLLEHGCYRSARLNLNNQSAYDIAVLTKESTRLLFARHEENDQLTKSSTRFYEQNAALCFDVVTVDENQKSHKKDQTILTFQTEEEKQHEIEYTACSKIWSQSAIGRFLVNRFHSDEPLTDTTITQDLKNLCEQIDTNNSDDNKKVKELIANYEENSSSIEQLLHLYTLETKFYRLLKTDCLPLAIPLYIHLPKLKQRFFQGQSYRGLHMTDEQLAVYEMAMITSGTVLQTRSFSSTSMNRRIAEEFAHTKRKKYEKDLSVLFIFDFPNRCDQAINLSRISPDIPCLSEYEDEEEILVLPWTLFEVKSIEKPNDKTNLYEIHLTNKMIPKTNLFSTFQWSWVEFRNQFIRHRKLQFDCAFQKYKTSMK